MPACTEDVAATTETNRAVTVRLDFNLIFRLPEQQLWERGSENFCKTDGAVCADFQATQECSVRGGHSLPHLPGFNTLFERAATRAAAQTDRHRGRRTKALLRRPASIQVERPIDRRTHRMASTCVPPPSGQWTFVESIRRRTAGRPSPSVPLVLNPSRKHASTSAMPGP